MPGPIRLTEFSHGAGCGCKISPAVLNAILAGSRSEPKPPALLVGHESRDDAAAYDLGHGQVLLSTTDFFMPIVDDPCTFGRVAATNAMSDVYAMGGSPIFALAVLGWPIDRLGPEVAHEVIVGARDACRDAGISIAGGHSIDAPEPIFGLVVNGLVSRRALRRNDTARAGDLLYLTKPLGIGVLTTAEKKKVLRPEHQGLAARIMCQLNDLGPTLAAIDDVHAMTDVTGFGLMGHLLEMVQGSDLAATVHLDAVPTLDGVYDYLELGCAPGGTDRNFDSYRQHLGAMSDSARGVLCDPQTSGGLLVAVQPDAADTVAAAANRVGWTLARIGTLSQPQGGPRVQVL